MVSVERTEAADDFSRLVALVEETGERVTLTEDDQVVGVLIPAAELAALEYWAQRHHGRPIPLPNAAEERPPGPAEHGPYMQYVHMDGGCMTFTRGRMVVAELRPADWFDWLEQQAVYGRQGYMSPEQSAAFAEFLARQPPVGEQ
ncbi:type II toxin-antitoxin system Phd/YefM family antitoxin [Streptomyces piniterrae]|uniref:Type II toxin-antitoxin system Phd/YefM family antitoxin n=2 Tax=Streptomyces piniterrae TaxID=2571125 RepID=A0A4U0MUK2_9ACTN|nr:type II toxin-antitoxin system Phd/YefM family antitoxin [Streptomyces piniterrae]